MGVELTANEYGELSLSFTGQSTAQVLTLAREVIPDIDERYANLVGSFRSGDGDSPEDPDDGARGDDPGGRPSGQGGAVGSDGDAGPVEGEQEGTVDPGEGMAPTVEEGVTDTSASNAPACSICGGDVPPDFADMMIVKHGEIFCPAHGTW